MDTVFGSPLRFVAMPEGRQVARVTWRRCGYAAEMSPERWSDFAVYMARRFLSVCGAVGAALGTRAYQCGGSVRWRAVTRAANLVRVFRAQARASVTDD